MTVLVDGETRYSWPVSTGMKGYATPAGTFRPFRLEEEHYSKEWDDAPMPHSSFYPRLGREPRQQRDPTSWVTCVARLHPDRTRECRQAICARQRRGTEQHESWSDRWTGRPRCERSDTSSATASPQTGTGLRRGGFRRALLPAPRNTVVCLVSARPTAVFSLASPLDAWVGGPSPLGGGCPESPASHSIHATSRSLWHCRSRPCARPRHPQRSGPSRRAPPSERAARAERRPPAAARHRR